MANQDLRDTLPGVPKPSNKKLEHEAEGALSGALAGGALGAIGGPPGAAVGAVIGAVAGAITGAALDREAKVDAARDAELDEAIGVTAEDEPNAELGAPNLAHPPAKVGLYSAASAGASSVTEDAPAEGPIPPES